MKVSTVVYQQSSSATAASFWKVGVRYWIVGSDWKSEDNEQGKCEKAPNQYVQHKKTCEDSAPTFVVCMHSLKTTCLS